MYNATDTQAWMTFAFLINMLVINAFSEMKTMRLWAISEKWPNIGEACTLQPDTRPDRNENLRREWVRMPSENLCSHNDSLLTRVIGVPAEVAHRVHTYLLSNRFIVSALRDRRKSSTSKPKRYFAEPSTGDDYKRMIQTLFNPLTYISHYVSFESGAKCTTRMLTECSSSNRSTFQLQVRRCSLHVAPKMCRLLRRRHHVQCQKPRQLRPRVSTCGLLMQFSRLQLGF